MTIAQFIYRDSPSLLPRKGKDHWKTDTEEESSIGFDLIPYVGVSQDINYQWTPLEAGDIGKRTREAVCAKTPSLYVKAKGQGHVT